MSSALKLFLLFLILSFLQLLPVAYFLQPVSADWIFDATPPNCSIITGSVYTVGSDKIIKVTVPSDTDAAINTDTASITVGVDAGTLNPFDMTKTIQKVYEWIVTSLSGSHTITSTIVDTAGNQSICTVTPTIPSAPSPTSGNPWVKTNDGDVHSNQ